MDIPSTQPQRRSVSQRVNLPEAPVDLPPQANKVSSPYTANAHPNRFGFSIHAQYHHVDIRAIQYRAA